MDKEIANIKSNIIRLNTRINELKAEKKAITNSSSQVRLNLIEAELDNLTLELKKEVLRAAGLEEKLEKVEGLDITII